MRELIDILMAGLLLLCGGTAMAASGTTSETRTFGAFDRVEISRGVEIHIGCGPEAKAELTGPAADLADFTTAVTGSTLRIRRGSVIGAAHDNSVVVRLTSPAPLVGISASTGVSGEVEACAVSPDHLDISASTGVDLALAGHTGRVDISASTGSKIQPLAGQRFDARDAKVSANTGADIRLCSVDRIEGSASMGADIVADSKSGTVHTAMGASFSVESCP